MVKTAGVYLTPAVSPWLGEDLKTREFICWEGNGRNAVPIVVCAKVSHLWYRKKIDPVRIAFPFRLCHQDVDW